MKAKAVEIVAELEPHPGPHTAGFTYYDSEFREWQRVNDLGMNRNDGHRSGRPLEMYYYYRASHTPLIPVGEARGVAVVMPNDPTFGPPGSVLVRTDYLGRLLTFHRVPSGEPTPARPFDPPRLFALAGLDPNAFQPTEPKRDWAVRHDRRYAWVGIYPERPDIPLTVEAATDNGELMAFRLVAPWTPPESETGDQIQRTVWEEVWGNLFRTVIPGLILAVGGALAFWNVRKGRADVRGSVTLALVTLALIPAVYVSYRVAEPTSQALDAWLKESIQKWGTEGLLNALAYLAFEPFVRRIWPAHLVGWTRLINGRWRDPMVGRDLLTGAALGALTALVVLGTIPVPKWLGLPPDQSLQYYVLGSPVPHLIGPVLVGLLLSVTLTFVLFLASRVLRKAWLWLPLSVGFLMLIGGDPRVHQWVFTTPMLGCSIAITWLFYRRGFLAVFSAATFTYWHLGGFLTFDLNTTYWPTTVSNFTVILLTLGYALVVSVGGWKRLIWGEKAG